jgi:hypothetical protein
MDGSLLAYFALLGEYNDPVRPAGFSALFPFRCRCRPECYGSNTKPVHTFIINPLCDSACKSEAGFLSHVIAVRSHGRRLQV